MVNRPAGGSRSANHLRAPLDWYIEPARAVEQLLHAIDFGEDVIWDGCCGRGTVLEVASRYGHPVIGSDLQDRRRAYADFAFTDFPWSRQDILQATRLPASNLGGRTWSYISNPPYGYSDGIAEKIMRHVLSLGPRRAAFLVPIAFLASTGRHRFFTRDCRPSHVAILSDRITCPPGHMLDELTNPFVGGMADYVWVVWTRPHRWRTECLWLSPGSHPSLPNHRKDDR
jgi:tRNA G10  N-methylase Trm11